MVPMSVRTTDDAGGVGNKVTMMLCALATDVDDPLERVEVIHECMAEAKEQQKAIGAETLQQWAEFAAPALFGRAMRLYSRMKVARSEESRVGKECVRTWRSGWAPH